MFKALKTKLSRVSVISLAAVALFSTPIMAEDESSVSANVTLATDYVWRGVSQTDQSPAIQGGFDWSGNSGVYAGVWGSNVDFSDSSSIEIDGYVGYATEFSNGWGLDVGFIHYSFWDDASGTNEVYVGTSYADFSGMLSTDSDSHYLDLGYSFDLGNGFGTGVHVGRYFGDTEYTDFSVSLDKSYSGLDFSLGYFDTDIDYDPGTDLANPAADSTYLSDGRVVLSISKSL